MALYEDRIIARLKALGDAGGGIQKISHGSTGSRIKWPDLPWGLIYDTGRIWDAASGIIRNLIKALADELDTGGAWFTWNGVDTSQFDAALEGTKVASSALSVVAAGGVNWLQCTVTGDATGGAGDWVKQSAMWPIVQQPPTTGNLIVADFYSVVQSTNPTGHPIVGAQVSPRFTSLSDAYVLALSEADASADAQNVLRVTAGEVTTTIGDPMADPNIFTAGVNGMRLGVAVEGDAVLTATMGEHQIIVDIASVVSTDGKCAIGVSADGSTSDTATVRFRNIRCYSVEGGVPQF